MNIILVFEKKHAKWRKEEKKTENEITKNSIVYKSNRCLWTKNNIHTCSEYYNRNTEIKSAKLEESSEM